jgi:tRNA A37 threonylcarbamoyladenosine dehydratase
MTNYEARFGGIKRLFGTDGQERLRRAHVGVIGIGGVGSWAVEALARTGVGALTLVDLDEICISNVNRQLHAVTGEFGKPKVGVMAERVRLINPDCRIQECQSLFTASTADAILAAKFTGVLDAIDSTTMKALLIAKCHALGMPIVTTGGAGGRRDPSLIKVDDLSRSTHDGLLSNVRKLLRTEHGFPRDPRRKFGVPCVYSPEPQVFPAKDGSVCTAPEPGSNLRLDCRSGYGTATFVTGAFGFVAAAEMVKLIARGHDSEKS